MDKVNETELLQREAVKSWFIQKIQNVKDNKLADCCADVLKNDIFFSKPAARRKHQAYPGGLADHTKEVLEVSLAMLDTETVRGMVRDPNRSYDLIYTAVLWHDFGKIWDYVECEDKNVYTRHRWSIRHLPRSYHEFMVSATSHGIDEPTKEEIGHIILAHHGRYEWGSPVEPLTPEASIVHFADCMSAYYSGKPHMFTLAPKEWNSAKGEEK